jgi:hypothetical protein
MALAMGLWWPNVLFYINYITLVQQPRWRIHSGYLVGANSLIVEEQRGVFIIAVTDSDGM